MSEDEILEKLEKLNTSDPDLANRIYELWEEDNTRDFSTLEKLAKVGFDSMVKRETDGVRRPVTEAFGISEAQYRLLVDPNSDVNWMTIPTKELLKAAIDGGYVKDLPKNASETEKREQRENFGNFVNMLAAESELQGRRNAVREYENTRFTEDPAGWAQTGINNLLFRTYAKRAKEQAMRGEGATGWSDMSAQDMATLGGDIGTNTLLGAGAGGLSRGLASGGLGTYGGARTFSNVAGSDLAAGLMGGLGTVVNRDINTEEGARGYEYLTEPAVTGALNVIATPASLRTGVSSAANMFGLGATKLGGMGKKDALRSVQRFADEKYAEPALATALKEMDASAARTVENSPVSAETMSKIEDMYEILNDGVSPTHGESTSLFDQLQALYEKSARSKSGVSGDQSIYDELGEFHLTPNEDRFRTALDNKIEDLQGAMKNDKGTAEGVAESRELKYFKNFRDMMDNGFIEPQKYLDDVAPVRLSPPSSKYVLTNGTADVPFFELGKKAKQSDIDFMKDYIQNVNRGLNIAYDNGLALKVRELSEKYPEFGRYVASQKMVPSHNVSFWPSRGSKVADNTVSVVVPETNLSRTAGMRAYGHRPEKISDPNEPAQWNAKDVLRYAGYAGREAGLDIAKPAFVEARLTKYDKPDNSLDALEKKYQKLRKDKPEAVDNAMSFKYDPRIPKEKQLTMEDRDIIDKYREAKRKEVLGE